MVTTRRSRLNPLFCILIFLTSSMIKEKWKKSRNKSFSNQRTWMVQLILNNILWLSYVEPVVEFGSWNRLRFVDQKWRNEPLFVPAKWHSNTINSTSGHLARTIQSLCGVNTSRPFPVSKPKLICFSSKLKPVKFHWNNIDFIVKL